MIQLGDRHYRRDAGVWTYTDAVCSGNTEHNAYLVAALTQIAGHLDANAQVLQLVREMREDLRKL